jgi:hypothetical protein
MRLGEETRGEVIAARWGVIYPFKSTLISQIVDREIQIAIFSSLTVVSRSITRLEKKVALII